jgi:hypothetical protein
MAANPTTQQAFEAHPTLKSVKRTRVLAIGVERSMCAALDVPSFDGELVIAASGPEVAPALEAWTQDLERFDAVLCNVREGDETGVHVYRAVLRARPDLAARVVFVVDDGTSARRHYLLGEVANLIVEAGTDARSLRALLRRV